MFPSQKTKKMPPLRVWSLAIVALAVLFIPSDSVPTPYSSKTNKTAPMIVNTGFCIDDEEDNHDCVRCRSLNRLKPCGQCVDDPADCGPCLPGYKADMVTGHSGLKETLICSKEKRATRTTKKPTG